MSKSEKETIVVIFLTAVYMRDFRFKLPIAYCSFSIWDRTGHEKENLAREDNSNLFISKGSEYLTFFGIKWSLNQNGENYSSGNKKLDNKRLSIENLKKNDNNKNN